MTRPAAAPANPGWSSGQLSFGGLALVAGLLLAPLVGFRLGALGRFLLLALHPNDLDVGGRTLTRGPRGTDPDHPRLELLCRTAMTILRELPRDELLHTPAAAERVFDVWRDGADIARWLARHVGLASPPK